jgi:flagellar motor switch protein FliG
MEDSGVEQAAILLMSVGEEDAAEVFKYLSPKEVQKVGETMARMSTVPRERIEQIVLRFHAERAGNISLVRDSDEYVSQVLRKALGEEKAKLLIERIVQGNDVSGIESMKWMDADSVAELLKNEHPQIMASILVHLERDQAAGVLKSLGERMRNDVLVRIATLEGIQPHALDELNEALSRVLAGSDKVRKASLGGAKAAAEILNFLGGAAENAVIESIREQDGELAQKVLDQMFTFDNVNDLDDKALQAVLREVQSDSLIVALKGADQALRERFYKNMSSRAAESMREDLESKGPVRVSEVEAEQREILVIIRRLADEGQIQLGGGGDGSDVFI